MKTCTRFDDSSYKFEAQIKNISCNTDFSKDIILLTKFNLLSYGLTLTDSARSQIQKQNNIKLPQQVRSGASNGLDIVLPHGQWVNVPIYNNDTYHQPTFLLDWQEEYVLYTEQDPSNTIPILIAPKPKYYDLHTSSNTPMHLVGQMFTDRIGFGLRNSCYFWKKERRCSFCTIGFKDQEEVPIKHTQDIIETLKAALKDPIYSPKHILISGGTFPNDGWTTKPFAEIAREIRKFTQLPLYLMAVPPTDLSELETLREVGYTEIALNIEIFSKEYAKKIIPGKHHEIGLERYLQAIAAARQYWGRAEVRSLLVAGLEPPESTLEGVEQILDAGGTPILSAFRPLNGSRLVHHPHVNPEWFSTLHKESSRLAGKYNAEIGPICNACKANCIA